MMWIDAMEEILSGGGLAGWELTQLSLESGHIYFNATLYRPGSWRGWTVADLNLVSYHQEMVMFRGVPRMEGRLSDRELLKTWRKFSRGRLPLEAVLDRIVTLEIKSHAERLANPPLALSIENNEEPHLKDGPAGEAQFSQPYDLAIAPDGSVFVADQLNHAIRKISPDGQVSTLAGGQLGDEDGVGTAARFAFPSALALAPDGWLYIADTFNHRIRRLRPDQANPEVETVAGWKPGLPRVLHFPQGIAVAPDNTLYVADSWNHRICRMLPGGELKPFVGEWGSKAGQFSRPYGLATDQAGNLYVADSWNHRICRVTPEGKVRTLAGKKPGFRDGKGAQAAFYHPYGLAVDALGNVLVADTWNHRLRFVTPKGEVTTLLGRSLREHEGSPLPGDTDDSLLEPRGVGVGPDGSIMIANTLEHDFRRLNSDGTVSRFAGGQQTADTLGKSNDGFYPAVDP